MKMTKFTYLLVFGLILTVGAVGCRKKPTYLTPLPNGGRAGTGTEIDSGGTVGGGSTGSGSGVTGSPGEGFAAAPAGKYDGWNEDATTLKSETIYFDFDSSAIRADQQDKVSKVADYLKSNTAAALRVEGHCDERGTEEYNRALGTRRALSVREALIAGGINPIRIVTLSLGEDRPVAAGQTEEAYRQNRRGEFIVLTAPK